MAVSLPYLPSYKNVERLFAAIAAAKVPETFSQAFLMQTLGLKASGDRPLIPMLRTLGFIDASGRPTPEYRELKNPQHARVAIARAIRKAYAPLFAANENTHALTTEQLRGLVAQVAGTDAEMTKRIGYTFTALAKLGDFTSTGSEQLGLSGELVEEGDSDGEQTEVEETPQRPRASRGGSLRPEFHYNLQIHIPANGTEETYLNIFNAMRKVFQ